VAVHLSSNLLLPVDEAGGNVEFAPDSPLRGHAGRLGAAPRTRFQSAGALGIMRRGRHLSAHVRRSGSRQDRAGECGRRGRSRKRLPSSPALVGLLMGWPSIALSIPLRWQPREGLDALRPADGRVVHLGPARASCCISSCKKPRACLTGCSHSKGLPTLSLTMPAALRNDVDWCRRGRLRTRPPVLPSLEPLGHPSPSRMAADAYSLQSKPVCKIEFQRWCIVSAIRPESTAVPKSRIHRRPRDRLLGSKTPDWPG